MGARALRCVRDRIEPWVGEFGDLVTDARASYQKGDSVQVQLWAADPNNHLFIESSYLEIQRENGSTWEVVAVDGGILKLSLFGTKKWRVTV